MSDDQKTVIVPAIGKDGTTLGASSTAEVAPNHADEEGDNKRAATQEELLDRRDWNL